MKLLAIAYDDVSIYSTVIVGIDAAHIVVSFTLKL